MKLHPYYGKFALEKNYSLAKNSVHVGCDQLDEISLPERTLQLLIAIYSSDGAETDIQFERHEQVARGYSCEETNFLEPELGD